MIRLLACVARAHAHTTDLVVTTLEIKAVVRREAFIWLLVDFVQKSAIMNVRHHRDNKPCFLALNARYVRPGAGLMKCKLLSVPH